MKNELQELKNRIESRKELCKNDFENNDMTNEEYMIVMREADHYISLIDSLML